MDKKQNEIDSLLTHLDLRKFHLRWICPRGDETKIVLKTDLKDINISVGATHSIIIDGQVLSDIKEANYQVFKIDKKNHINMVLLY